MDPSRFDLQNIDIQWCPGCGDFKILDALKGALAELHLAPEEVVIVSGIGQAAKTPHFMKAHFFNGLHGRALSNATAIKASNPFLSIIAIGGDGDMYGEGGNHFIHTIRRNPDITNIVCNNMVYGLTKGQASPTSPIGFKTPVQVHGVINEPFNPLSIAVSQKASFVARAFAGDLEKTKEILKRAIVHKGYSLVDIFQPCVTFNKVNTYKWFMDNSYYLDETYDSGDIEQAIVLAMKEDKYPLGVLYEDNGRGPFEENLGVYNEDKRPLFERELDMEKFKALLEMQK